MRIGLADFPAGPGDDADSPLSDGIDQVPSQSIAGNAHQPFFPFRLVMRFHVDVAISKHKFFSSGDLKQEPA